MVMEPIEFTEKNPKLFYDAAGFPFLKPLTDHFQLLKDELLELISSGNEDQWLRTFPDYVSSEKKKAWKVFSFMFFSMKFPHHAALCPKTSELVYAIPEILSCDYSYLKPNTHILPHKGYTRMVLRCHLPLIVPDETQCGIRVGNITRHWKEGELMIFDDSFEHEAWNHTDKPRAVLMFDIPNPLWGYSAYDISKYKIENLEDPFLLSLADKETWLKSFESQTFPLERFID